MEKQGSGGHPESHQGSSDPIPRWRSYRQVGVEVQALHQVSSLPGAGLWGWLITTSRVETPPPYLSSDVTTPPLPVTSQPDEGRSLSSLAGVLGGWLGRWPGAGGAARLTVFAPVSA